MPSVWLCDLMFITDQCNSKKTPNAFTWQRKGHWRLVNTDGKHINTVCLWYRHCHLWLFHLFFLLWQLFYENRHISHFWRLNIKLRSICLSIYAFIQPYIYCKWTLTQFSASTSVSLTLVHFFSFVNSCLSWFLSTEADRCCWLVLLSTESGKATPSTQLLSIYPKQLWYSNITTVHSV